MHSSSSCMHYAGRFPWVNSYHENSLYKLLSPAVPLQMGPTCREPTAACSREPVKRKTRNPLRHEGCFSCRHPSDQTPKWADSGEPETP